MKPADPNFESNYGKPDDGWRLVASVMMLIGWGTLAVPTGIVSAEFTAQRFGEVPTTRTCHECLREGHPTHAKFCRDCGAALPDYQRDGPS